MLVGWFINLQLHVQLCISVFLFRRLMMNWFDVYVGYNLIDIKCLFVFKKHFSTQTLVSLLDTTFVKVLGIT